MPLRAAITVLVALVAGVWATVAFALTPDRSSSAASAAATERALSAADARAIDGYVRSIAVEPDGSVRLATIPSRYGAPIGIREYRVAPSGAFGTPRALVPANARIGWAASDFTADGAVAAYGIRGKKKRSVIRSVIWGPAGPLGRSQTLSDGRHGARGLTVVAGPSGAAAVVFMQGRSGRRWQDMIAIRRAGAARFEKAVPLGRIRGRDSFAGDIPDRIEVEFAPDGSGAIAQVPEAPTGSLRLRRIGTDGAVSRAITVAPGPYELSFSDLGIAGDGTLVAAFRVLDEEAFATALLASTLPPGATKATPVQKLGEAGNPSEDDRDLGLALTPGAPALLASGHDRGGSIFLFEGAPTALERVGELAAFEHNALTVAASGDGGTSIFWTGAVDASAERFAVMGTHRAPGGAWTKPAPITSPTDEDGLPEIAVVAPVPGAGVVLALQRPIDMGARRVVELVRAP